MQKKFQWKNNNFINGFLIDSLFAIIGIAFNFTFSAGVSTVINTVYNSVNK